MIACACGATDLLAAGGAGVAGHGLSRCVGQYALPAWATAALVQLEHDHRTNPFRYSRVASTVQVVGVRSREERANE